MGFKGISWWFNGILWDLMGFHDDLMGFYGAIICKWSIMGILLLLYGDLNGEWWVEWWLIELALG